MTEQELTAAIREVRVRVESRNRRVAAADLMPLLHARDRAEAKAALIGTVNPRLPGPGNAAIQWVKRGIARGLRWFVREQVEFNRAAMDCIQAALEALTETSRALDALEQRVAQIGEQRERADIHVLKSVAQLQASFKIKAEELEASYRERADRQHREFAGEASRTAAAIRDEMERLIQTELRLIRQRAALAGVIERATGPAASREQPAGSPAPRFSDPQPPQPPAPRVDWLRFAERFRGPAERVKDHQRRWIGRFKDCGPVLDLGCGRGEFLELAREAGMDARGIDHSAECVALCRSKGLAAQEAELIEHLSALADRSLGGIFCAHVIEHLEPARLAELIALLGVKTRAGARVLFETPDPECPETMAAHFWADPTHVRPVPASLLQFYLEEAGFGSIEIERAGGDYAVTATKL